jgi:pimeloyl-ACP methyl ester carboxylesterase
MLENESLAKQKLNTDASFLHGQLDHKYVQLYQRLKIPSLEIPNAGHPVHIENPEGCAEAIKRLLRLGPPDRLERMEDEMDYGLNNLHGFD